MDFNFNSQICTTREQSERLFSLGLKKETADMVHSTIVILDNLVDLISEHPWTARQEVTNDWYPAWSLGRLLELSYGDVHPNNVVSISAHNPFEYMIKTIEGFIKNQCFNKEYLEE